MTCEDCENARDDGQVLFCKVGEANVGVLGCAKHFEWVTDAIVEYREKHGERENGDESFIDSLIGSSWSRVVLSAVVSFEVMYLLVIARRYMFDYGTSLEIALLVAIIIMAAPGIATAAWYELFIVDRGDE